jgi:hypothetical protein
VQVNLQGIRYYALVPLPVETIDTQDLIALRLTGPIIYLVLISIVQSPNKEHLNYLERYNNIRVYTGYGISTILIRPDELQDKWEEDD